ncbi:MAG: tetratricopeptide repeat protein [Sphingorhabdus sp.]
MNGWLVVSILAGIVGAITLMLVKPRKLLWQPVAAALMLGMAGYAMQGRPDLPTVRAEPIMEERGAAEALIQMRADMDQSFGVAKRWLVTADGLARSGSYGAAAGYIQAGLREHPDNPDLWSALGLVLMLAADGELTPAAQLAFDKARRIAPNRPSPDYFEGLAALFARKPEVAIVKWQAVLARGTPKAKWRPAVESQLQRLEFLLTQPEQPSNQ